MTPVKVSVLMPIYNTNEKFLREAIESILAQTYQNFELLILNDSPDNTHLDDVVSSYNDPRIIYAKNEKNMGISKSRNKLMKMAKGEYFAVFDHDDVSLPLRFEKQVAYLDFHPEVGVCGSFFGLLNKNKITKKPVSSDLIENALMMGCAVHHPSSMIRASVLKENHIEYEEEFTPAEDYALWARLIGKTKFYNIPEPLILYRMHDTQTSCIQEEKMKRATEKIHAFVRHDNPNIWKKVCEEVPCIVRVKLFNMIPVAKFKTTGYMYKGVLKYIPFLTIRVKECVE